MGAPRSDDAALGAVARLSPRTAGLSTGCGARTVGAFAPADAVAAADRRVRANPNDAAAHRDLASLYLKQGRQDEAFAEVAIAAWLDPDDPLTFVTLGQSLMADGRDEDAVAALERAVLRLLK